MIEPFTFSAAGTPRPKSRPRFVKGRVVSTASAHEKLWRLAVERAVVAAVVNSGRAVPLFAGPVVLRCRFTFEPPASEPGRIGTPHTLKPDTDNLEKLVADAMERAGVFRNDSQVVCATTEKWWGVRAGVAVVVEPVGAEPAPVTASVDPSPPDWLMQGLGLAVPD